MPSMNQITNGIIGYDLDKFGTRTPRYATLRRDVKDFRYGKGGHYGYPSMSLPNVGGPMYLDAHVDSYGSTADFDAWPLGATNPNGFHYKGHFVADVPSGGFWNGTFTPDAWGATAYSKMKPTKPSFQALNAIYELREVPAMLKQKFLDPKNPLASIGNYHLALQFGWKPLLADIRNTVLTQMSMQKRLNWLLRHNGKPVKTAVTLLDTSSIVSDVSSPLDYGALQPVLSTNYYRSATKSRVIQSQAEKVWARARFRYWLPDGPRDVNWTNRMKAALFGFQPSPSVIYNAVPWSWLNDWFSNTGDILENLDAGVASRCAADYFYVMRYKEYRIEKTGFGYLWSQDGQFIDVTASSYAYSTVKSRAEGDPFGFATQENSLSGMQLSILGALGMSRLKR